MAKAVVTLFLVKLEALLTQEESLLAGVYVQVVSLVDGFRRVHDLIENAEMNCRKSEAMRKLVEDIINVTYDAEDAIDNFILEIERQRRFNIERKHCRRLVGFLRRHASKELETRLGNLIEDTTRCIDDMFAENMIHFEEEEGMDIRRRIITADWELEHGHDQFKSMLALSYDHLPYYLKPCFLYLGLFPQAFEFQTERLIQMWVAEGFVQQRGEEAMEEVADNYLDELVSRRMIEATRRRKNGRVKACRIHNLIRDFAVLEAMKLNVFRIYPHHGLSSPIANERTLIIHNNNYVSPEHLTPFLRSFIAININEEVLQIAFKSLFAECKLLKVLDLDGSNISRLPAEIEGLINLRYLGLRFTGLVSLPVSIGNLHKLQTLDVRGTSISSLPASIGNLENLRTLDVRDTSIGSLPDSVGNLGYLRTLDLRGTSISNLPSCIGNLRHLQTLDIRGTSIRSLPEDFWKIQHLRHVYLDEDSEIIPVSLGMDYQLKYLQTLKYARAGNWKNDMLGNLTEIRRLCIMDMSSSHTKGLCDSIANFHRLTSLTLQGYDPIPKLNLSHHRDLRKLDLSVPLENLPELHEFPPDLTKLNLLWSELMQDPLPTLGKLCNLRSLKIKANAYRGKEMGCSSLGFSQPKDLELVEMGCSSLGFPQLEDLELAGLYELERCRFQEGDMPRLTRISKWDCPSMKLLPEGLEHLTSLQVLRIFHMPEDFYSRLQENEGSFRFKIHKSGWFSKYVPL